MRDGKFEFTVTELEDEVQQIDDFLNEVNLGNSLDGVVVFDLPKKATPATLELHDSMFSDGVEVSVK